MSERCPYCRESLNKVTVYCPKCGDVNKNGNPVTKSFGFRLKRAMRKGMQHKCDINIKIKCSNCKKVLPDFIWESEPINLAIIGPSNAGKSHFFAVMYHQLKYETGIDYGIIVNIEDSKQEENYTNNYYNPLYVTKDENGKPIKVEEQRILERTVADEDDIDDMQFFVTIENNDDVKKKVCLVYNDTPGGSLSKEDKIYGYSDFFPNAKGIFILLGNIVEMDKETRREIIDMVLKIRQIIRTKKPFVAVVMTKCDEYKEAYTSKTENLTTSVSNMPNGIAGMVGRMGFETDLNITDTTRDKIRTNMSASKKLIDDCKQGEAPLRQLVNIVEDLGSGNVAYFTVSALGDTLEEIEIVDKNNDKRKKKVLKEGMVPDPIDIELPLIWMLSKYKLIKEI